MEGHVDESDQHARLEHHVYERTKPVTCLDDLHVISCSPKSVTLRTRVAPTSLNLRGFAHGGWLFTLCDAASGALVFSRGLDCVTQQASINYLRGAAAGEQITIRVQNLHWGRSTVVNVVTLTNADDKPIASCTITMFVMGEALD